MMPRNRPNFLFIITDQHRADWLGCYGHPVVKTPNLDALAAEGTRFDNFHVATPVCMPNRASLLTGRMPSVHGLRYNGCSLSRDANGFTDVLAAGGYNTASIGKSHMEPFSRANSWHTDHNREAGRLIEEAWKTGETQSQEDPRLYDGDDHEGETPYFGYRHVETCAHHGTACGGHYKQWFQAQRPDDWEDLRDSKNQLPHNYTCPQANRTPIPEDLYTTTWVADRAIDYIDAQKGDDTPFFAFVSFPDPHHPFNPPGKYWDMYDPDDFEIPLPYSAHKNPTPPMQWLEENFRGEAKQMTVQTAIYADDQAIREAMALTAGMIAMIDDQVVRIIQALKDSGRHEDTVIVFNSDHGDYLGDFNLLLKDLLHLRGVNRVPFIWSDPGNRNAAVTDTMASTIDIPATVLDRAGLKPHYGMQGVSFLPTLEKSADHREEVLIEFNDGAPKSGFEKPARVRSIVTKEWRYTMYAEQDWGELYDLSNDPGETHNLWDDPAHTATRAHFAERLTHHLTLQMDESPRAVLVA